MACHVALKMMPYLVSVYKKNSRAKRVVNVSGKDLSAMVCMIVTTNRMKLVLIALDRWRQLTIKNGVCHATEPEFFKCESDGSCIPFSKRCNGVTDCDDGSDEGRAQNCQTFVSKIRCEKQLNITVQSDGYTEKWTGNFRCNNGQCIEAQYVCDGVAGDCTDGSDEYPDFNKAKESPWLVPCPYSMQEEMRRNSSKFTVKHGAVLCGIKTTCYATYTIQIASD
eukprot:82975_1